MYYRSLNEELREKFGEKLYKLALDGGFTCPNRDGTIGSRGCTFCLGGSGSFAEGQCASVSEQIGVESGSMSGAGMDSAPLCRRR